MSQHFSLVAKAFWWSVGGQLIISLWAVDGQLVVSLWSNGGRNALGWSHRPPVNPLYLCRLSGIGGRVVDFFDIACACMRTCARMCARNNKVFIYLRSYRFPRTISRWHPEHTGKQESDSNLQGCVWQRYALRRTKQMLMTDWGQAYSNDRQRYSYNLF